ncbi:Maf family protein [Georgenia sp. H159]|uniref:Maf family protein n=1 Tax=Georgenia sp. H159 TaxID=3076115 RepID=UPI003A5D0740
MTLVLASASPARLATLRTAGFAPEVQVSSVDEPALLRDAGPDATPADQVLLLARAKARDVAATRQGALVIGCDSMLELDGEVHGKPTDAREAVARWHRMRGRSGVLHTGHWLVDTRGGATRGGVTRSRAARAGASRAGAQAGGVSSTTVHFADLSDAEVEAYVATGEPLAVAGAFTVDGLGGPFVTRIEGDHHGVVGLSLPLLRTLLAELGVAVTDLWAR